MEILKLTKNILRYGLVNKKHLIIKWSIVLLALLTIVIGGIWLGRQMVNTEMSPMQYHLSQEE